MTKKQISVDEQTHEQLVAYAKANGMTVSGAYHRAVVYMLDAKKFKKLPASRKKES